MTWAFKTVLPTGSTFDGEMVFDSTDLEVDNDIKRFMESIDYVIDQYEIKHTGFEKKKYKKTDASNAIISITLVGDLPFYWHQILLRLAIAINGSGATLQFKDAWVSGTLASPVTYTCRWINAGDFVETSELLNGGTMELEAYTMPEAEGRYAVPGVPDAGVYQETIDVPVSGFEWTEVIEEGDADEIYYEVI
jgi:hypothetical protein